MDIEDFESGVKKFLDSRTASLQKEPIKELKRSQKEADKRSVKR